MCNCQEQKELRMCGTCQEITRKWKDAKVDMWVCEDCGDYE